MLTKDEVFLGTDREEKFRFHWKRISSGVDALGSCWVRNFWNLKDVEGPCLVLEDDIWLGSSGSDFGCGSQIGMGRECWICCRLWRCWGGSRSGILRKEMKDIGTIEISAINEFVTPY